MNLTVKQISSLEKIREYSELPLRGFSNHTILAGESFSYQLVVSSAERARITVSVKSNISEHVKLYLVNDAAMDYPHGPEDDGGDYMTDTPPVLCQIFSFPRKSRIISLSFTATSDRFG